MEAPNDFRRVASSDNDNVFQQSVVELEQMRFTRIVVRACVKTSKHFARSTVRRAVW